MSVSKDTSQGTWTVYARYTDWQGKVKVLHKRGFKTKREAVEYEREYLLKKSKDVTMGFAQFVECYLEDLKPRLKYNTYLTKEHIIRTKILPYFEDKALADICTSDIMQWQNEILQMRDDVGKGYSPTYLKTISAQMSAIFNHATRFYDLKDNPCQKVGNMGKKKAKEMLFWTRDEFFRFIETMKSKPMSYYAFELLFWTGIREGELLALTRDDVDLEKKILHIRKSYQRLERKDVITEPKTEKSNRDINLPDFLCEELEDYFGMLYKCNNDTRLFGVSKHYLQHEMKRGCKESGVKRIRIHDLRHSHVAYLIELGFSPVEIAERMGHESISVTFTYSHLYPSKQKSLADKLNADREKALEGADGVVITVLTAGPDIFRTDIEIPKKYGVDICVGA